MYKLMIVEDEDVIRGGLKEQVPWDRYGFQVVGEADNGRSALELIPQLMPDVILTDIMMPVMDGMELLARVSESYDNIKVVVLSGYSEFEYARKCIEYRAFNYLLKPTDDHEIEHVFLKARDELDRGNGGNSKLFESHRPSMYTLSSDPDESRSGFDERFHQESGTCIQELVRCTISGNGPLVDACLDRFVNLFGSGNLKPGDKDILFMKMVEWMLLLSSRARENKIDLSPLYGNHMHHEIRSRIERGVTDLRVWLADMCREVMRLRADQAEITSYDPVVEQAIAYLSEHYDRKITLEEVCNQVNISPSYLCSLFKQKTGETLMGYLTNIRMAKAKELLSNKSMKVYEVAIMVGFDDFRHFSKTFKKAAGINPLEYRDGL